MEMPTYRPGLEGVIATTTSVSYLDVDIEQILVRGYDLIELARELKYSDVAYLVIYGNLPNSSQSEEFAKELTSKAEIPEELYRLFELMPKNTSVMDALRTGVSFLSGYESPDRLGNNSYDTNLERGINLLAKVPTIAVSAYRVLHGLSVVRPNPNIGYSENFLYMITGILPDAESTDAFDKIHTCYIEHEMPNSTFAARVIASTLSDMYGAVTGAVASLKGPLHGGANEAAIKMVLEILTDGGPDKAEAYTMNKLKRRERIMGFGHRVYMKKYDPRALFLRDYIPRLADNIPNGMQISDIYKKVEYVMNREKGLYPNTDYPIGILYYMLGIPIPLYTPIFLCSRMAGLAAHVLEQHDDNRLFRPRVIYNGRRGLTI